jgi:large subunit ribosomal protein L23
MSLDLRQVIVKPLVTEKSSAVYQLQKAYTFEVHPEASKHQIREALERLFDVKVTDVRTMQMRRNEVTRGKTRGTTARWKKAIVTLRDGQTLPVFEG